LNKKDITLKEYRTLLLRIRSKVIDFFERNRENLHIYKDMSINDIMKEILGEEEYERALASIDTSGKIEGSITENPRELVIIDELEKLDGGRRRKINKRQNRRTRRVRKTNKRRHKRTQKKLQNKLKM
jgi:hypothetical protein